MSWKSNFPDGIVLNCEHDGLLTVAEERLISIIKKEPISNVYHVEQTPFARGKFAAVRKCTHQQTGVEYAAKFIRKRRRAMDQRQDIIHEVAVLRLSADCPFIVSLHEVFETSAEVALVLELAAGGELQTVLDVQEGLREAEVVLVMRQIIEGLGYLHDRNIAHLDLKPQNLLLTGTYPECDIKLCDFGISRVIQGGVEVREILGTPDYVAPEILSYEPISLATDIWSVGVLAYVLLSGFSPFGGDTKQETFLNISQCSLTFPPELFEGVSGQAREFIRAALQTEPKKRLTARQCLNHPWLSPHVSLPRCITVEKIHVGTDVGGVEKRDVGSVENVVGSVDKLVVGCGEKIAVDSVEKLAVDRVDKLAVGIVEKIVVDSADMNAVDRVDKLAIVSVDNIVVHSVEKIAVGCVEMCDVDGVEKIAVGSVENVVHSAKEIAVDREEKLVVDMSVVDSAEETETLPATSSNVACASLKVQPPRCVDVVRVEAVRVVNAASRPDLHSCRMGDDITRQYLRATGEGVGDRINGLRISSAGHPLERRVAVEMSHEDLPLHKRAKNCEDTCGFPHCRHLPTDNIRLNAPPNAGIERPLLC